MTQFIAQTKPDIEKEIVSLEKRLLELRTALSEDEFLDYSKCKNCGRLGWCYNNPFTMGMHPCTVCEWGKKAKLKDKSHGL